MRIPEKVTDYRLYNEAKDFIGVTDVTLPSLEAITESMSGAGILGEYDSTTPGQFQSMTLQMNVRTSTAQAFGLLQNASMFDLRGSVQNVETADAKQYQEEYRFITKGAVKKFDPGKIEKGKPMETAVEVEVLYYKVIIAGKVVLELDKLNYIYIVNGVDMLKDTREILGY